MADTKTKEDTKNANMSKVESALRKKQFIRFEMII